MWVVTWGQKSLSTKHVGELCHTVYCDTTFMLGQHMQAVAACACCC
jgi:hypothetical protein